jgi:hypothetical protein
VRQGVQGGQEVIGLILKSFWPLLVTVGVQILLVHVTTAGPRWMYRAAGFAAVDAFLAFIGIASFLSNRLIRTLRRGSR